MATQVGTASVLLRDFRGFTARVTGTVSGADAATAVTNADTFIGAIVGATNAAEVSRTGLDAGQVNPNSYGTNAEYSDIGMKARLVFADSSGALHAISIPAPKLAVFMTDQYTVNAAQTNIAALITLVNGGSVLFGKQALTGTYVNGFFQDRRRKRAINPRTKNPAGSGPA